MNESGVRNLKRCMEIIHTKLNLFRLMKPDNNLFSKDLSLNVSFPFRVSVDIVDKLIKRDENTNICQEIPITFGGKIIKTNTVRKRKYTKKNKNRKYRLANKTSKNKNKNKNNKNNKNK
jgi:hypothetical protein